MKIIQGTSSRHGGVSSGPWSSLNLAYQVGDDHANVAENRRRFLGQLGIVADQLVLPRQNHTTACRQVDRRDGGRGADSFDDGIADVDALYTFEHDLMVAVFHADCLAITFHNDDLVGVIHAGWRGSVDQITLKTIRHLIETHGVDVGTLRFSFSPCIQRESLEVGREVADEVREAIFIDGKYHLDIVDINLRQLASLGVKWRQIEISPIDTYRSGDYFSYRREATCGRHLTYIIRKA